METKIIARVNNVDILSTSDEQMVAIRPICEALGIDYSRQIKKIKEDIDLASTVGLESTVAADGKEREMFCLPLRYVFGWLFTINPINVKPEAQDSVRNYRRMCYDTLYDYFFKQPMRQLEQNKIEITLLEEITELNQQKSSITSTLTEKKKKLESVREERLKNEPRLFN